MVRVFQLYKSLGKVEKLSLRGTCVVSPSYFSREYEKAIDKAVEKFYTRTSVVNSMENPGEPSGVWWARGDLNPGPPPCEGGVLTRLDDGPTLIP